MDLVRNLEIPAKLTRLLKDAPLNDWEKNFCESLLVNFVKQGGLTEKQFYHLERLEKKFPTQEQSAEWLERFPSLKENWEILVKYYAGTQYYNSITDKWKRNPDYVPTQAEFEKLNNNNYAPKILTNALGEHEFPIYKFVFMRESSYHEKCFNEWRRYLRKIFLDPEKQSRAILNSKYHPFIVVQHLKSFGTAKGSKRYKIAPFGHPLLLEVEERWIKNARLN